MAEQASDAPLVKGAFAQGDECAPLGGRKQIAPCLP